MEAKVRGPYAKGIARREEILQTTLNVMAEKGYRQTSLRGIARELGLEPAHILHYFGSREKLLEAVIERRDVQNGERLASNPDTEDFFSIWIGAMRENLQVPGLVHLYTAFAAEAADDNHPSRQFMSERSKLLQRMIERDLVRGQADGLYPADLDVAYVASALIAHSDGLQLQWLINPDLDMVGAMERAIAVFTRTPLAQRERRSEKRAISKRAAPKAS